MARLRQPIAVPTNAPLQHSQLLPSLSPPVIRVLSRLSRPALVELALSWLSDANVERCPPYLASDEEEEGDEGFGAYEASQSIEELRDVWEDVQLRKGSKKDVLERIVEGDWRAGICLAMVAEADIRFLEEHTNSLRWSASRLSRVISSVDDNGDDVTMVVEDDPSKAKLPRFHGPTFVQQLHLELAPVFKAVRF
jgi:central kinetochore subunit Mis15/CHL4